MLRGTPDGSLEDWEDVASAEDWEVLLLGNGLSMNVWPKFGYRSLTEQAARSGRLTDQDRELFGRRTNFEGVLAELSTSIRVAQIVGLDTGPIYTRYRNIQRALGEVVHEVHPNKSDIPDETFAAIRSVMQGYEWVFTTSYDLIVYWAMKGEDGRYEPFKDHFQYRGRCEFDPDRARVAESDIPVYYLHGALHLVTGTAGKTWKVRATALRRILDQFGRVIDADPAARPLLVTEGSAGEKARAIEANDYLAHALDRLFDMEGPLVVFGSQLGKQDDHLVEALSEHPDRPVAISMLPRRSKAERAEFQIALSRRLNASEIYFYDATTHPLGSTELRAR
jgi:hypothetical protein